MRCGSPLEGQAEGWPVIEVREGVVSEPPKQAASNQAFIRRGAVSVARRKRGEMGVAILRGEFIERVMSVETAAALAAALLAAAERAEAVTDVS